MIRWFGRQGLVGQAGAGARPWTFADLFANGEAGLWLPYRPGYLYADVVNTVPAALGGGIASFDDLSGNGVTGPQPVSTARPIMGRVPRTGRRNLLQYTEEFDNPVWNNDNLSIASGITAPNGVYLPKLVENAADGAHRARQTITFPANTSAPQTLYAKAGERSWIYFGGLGRSPSATEGYTWFNLADGTVGTVSTNHTVLEYTHIGEGVYKIVILCAPAPTSVLREFRIGVTSSDTLQAHQGDGTSGAYVGGAQLETGSTATPYQRVTNEYDVTEAGVPSVHYARYDLADDVLPQDATLPAITDGTVILIGHQGIWIDEGYSFAGGDWSLGPTAYTDGPTGIIGIVGDMLDLVVLDRPLTADERDRVVAYGVKRGSAGLITVTENVFPQDYSVGWSSADERWTYNDSSVEWAGGGTGTSGSRLEVFSSNMANSISLLSHNLSDYSGTGNCGVENGTLGVSPGTVSTPLDTRVIGDGAYSFVGYFRGGGNGTGVTLLGRANNSFTISDISLRRLIMPGETP